MDEDVVRECCAEDVEKGLKYIVDEFQERCCCIDKSEMHDHGFKKTVVDFESCISFINFCYPNYDIGLLDIQFVIPSRFCDSQ
jgi:hypothetical protein